MSAEHPINTASWHKDLVQPTERDILNVEPEELASLIQKEDGKEPGAKRDFLVIDVRRADCETMIPSAINLPAQSFLPSLPSLLPLLHPIPLLIFHCGRRNGRGLRCARWMADALVKQMGLSEQEVLTKVKVLKGGHEGWKEAYGAASLESRTKREGLKLVQL